MMIPFTMLATWALSLWPVVDPSTIPRFRPCCAGGESVPTQLGPVPTPLVLDNVMDVSELGPHHYERRHWTDERSAFVYTCRGGLIDIGHVRNAADWVAYWATRLRDEQTFAQQTLEGRWDIQLESTSPEWTQQDAAIYAAEDLAYRQAVWHEILTALGHGITPLLSESYSALSPEDPYSDLLGAIIGAQALRSELPFNEAVTLYLNQWLTKLEPLPITQTRAAIVRLGKDWWHKGAPVPAPTYLRKRRLVTSLPLAPERVSVEGCSAPAQELTTTAKGRGYAAMLELPAAVANGIGQTHIDAKKHDALVHDHRAKLEAPELVLHKHPLWVGMSVLPVRLQWGVHKHRQDSPSLTKTTPAVGLGFDGFRAVATGGDITVARYDIRARENRTRHVLTAVRGRSLYFCSREDAIEIPILGWFRGCTSGMIGVDVDVAQFSYDPTLGDSVMRPLAVSVLVNPWGNGYSPSYYQGHLELGAGASVDMLHGFQSQTQTLGRAHGFVRLGAGWGPWRFDLEETARIGLAQERNRVWEQGASLRITSGFGEHPSGPPDWVVTFGVHGGVAYHDKPQWRLWPEGIVEQGPWASFARAQLEVSRARITF